MERLKIVGQWYQTQTLSPRDYPNMLVSSEEWSVKVPKDNFLKNYFHTFFVEQRGFVAECLCWCMDVVVVGEIVFHFFSSLRTRRARGTRAANRAMGELKRSAWSSSNDFQRRLWPFSVRRCRGCRNMLTGSVSERYTFNHHIAFSRISVLCWMDSQ